jgi:hypothetical protein
MDYHAKYLKYKAKYLDLKEKVGGNKENQLYVTNITNEECKKKKEIECKKPKNGCSWNTIQLSCSKDVCSQLTPDQCNNLVINKHSDFGVCEIRKPTAKLARRCDIKSK